MVRDGLAKSKEILKVMDIDRGVTNKIQLMETSAGARASSKRVDVLL